MRKPLVAANWKMNMTQAESAEFVRSLLLDIGDIREVDVVIIPPFTAIAKVTEALGKARLHSTEVLRISPDGSFSSARPASFETNCACAPALRAICAPLPGRSSML